MVEQHDEAGEVDRDQRRTDRGINWHRIAVGAGAGAVLGAAALIQQLATSTGPLFGCTDCVTKGQYETHVLSDARHFEHILDTKIASLEVRLTNLEGLASDYREFKNGGERFSQADGERLRAEMREELREMRREVRQLVLQLVRGAQLGQAIQ